MCGGNRHSLMFHKKNHISKSKPLDGSDTADKTQIVDFTLLDFIGATEPLSQRKGTA